ncbi:hypothetical protein ABG067_002110 [Albugo candida]
MSRGSSGSIGDYVVTSKIGSGSFAVVYKGYHKLTKLPVAIKALSLQKLNKKLLENLESEIAIMRQINHPNIVKLHDIKKTEKHIYLMLEYCAGGDLQQFMKRYNQPKDSDDRGSTALPENIAQHFLHELAKGMYCLWQHHWVHRDLKPQNLLLSEFSPNATLKIADFGFARHLTTTSMAETLCGSPLYMAPEILKFQKYDAKADLWSIGTILYEVLVGRPPFGGANHVQLLANIERTELRFPPSAAFSEPCIDLLKGLLQRSPLTRTGFEEFFQHPFVNLVVEGDSTNDYDLGIKENATESRDVTLHSLPVTAPNIHAEDRQQLEADLADKSLPRLSNAQPLSSAGSHMSLNINNELLQTVTKNAQDNRTMQRQEDNAESTPRSQPMCLKSNTVQRLTSSNRFFSKINGNSPKLSPQRSPDGGVIPSPRINPFKNITNQTLSRNSGTNRGIDISTKGISVPLHDPHALAKHYTSCPPFRTENHILDSSEEYVLVESSKQGKLASTSIRRDGLKPSSPRTSVAGNASTSQDAIVSSTITTSEAETAMHSATPRLAQQTVDATIHRIQAVATLAEKMWFLSLQLHEQIVSLEPISSTEQQHHSLNAISIFSMSPESSSASSRSSDAPASRQAPASTNDPAASGRWDNSDDGSSSHAVLERERFLSSGEALSLYIKCLRLIKNAITYMHQDPEIVRRQSSQPWSALANHWSLPSRKVTIAYLMEQLAICIDRADRCRKFIRSSSPECIKSCSNVVLRPDGIIYAHVIQLGKEGAMKEVLGQWDTAYKAYSQTVLLLQSVLTEEAVIFDEKLHARILQDLSASNVMVSADKKVLFLLLQSVEGRIRVVTKHTKKNGVLRYTQSASSW